MRVVAVSGGFDPLQVGHVRYFQEAKKLGDYLTVILNTDDWLMKKKGYVFMPYEEREEILLALECVDEVVPQLDTDETVCYSLEIYKPDIFAKGGDQNYGNIPELKTCLENGIELIFEVGGDKIASSSDYVKNAVQAYMVVAFRDWMKRQGVSYIDTKDGLHSDNRAKRSSDSGDNMGNCEAE